MASVIFALPPEAPVSCRGILAGRGGMKTASFPLLASCGAERFSDPLLGVIASVARDRGRWAELDGMSAPPSA
jgi:hypothetical protein